MSIRELVEFIDKEIEKRINEGRGEKSEANLESSVNALIAANKGSIKLSLGDFGERSIKGAQKVKGTPKTDILFVADDEKGDIGISMKLPSADFLDNRRTLQQMYDAVVRATASTRAADFFVSALLSGINQESLAWEKSPHPKTEKDALEKIVRSVARSDKYKGDLDELKNYKLEWDENGVKEKSVLWHLKYGTKNQRLARDEIVESFKTTVPKLTGIPANTYALQDFFDPEEYSKFLELVLGGTQIPPQGANAYFYGEIDRKNYSLEDLNAAFNKPWGDVKSFTTIPNARQELQDKYMPSFRLRAITPARAALGKDNHNHHKKGMVDQTSGLGWTTFIVK